MRIAKWIFGIAGTYGVLVIAPLFFLEPMIRRQRPGGITNPEFYYGFICVTLACQFMFLVIASDPVRYRALMPVGMWEKFSYGVACVVLNSQGRVDQTVMFFCGIDVVLGIAFVAAWFLTKSSPQVRTAGA